MNTPATVAHLTPDELNAKIDELSSIVSTTERHIPELKAARDTAATEVELLLPPDGARKDKAAYNAAEARLADCKVELARSQALHDESAAALAGIHKLLIERQDAERQAILDGHLGRAVTLLDERNAAIDRFVDAASEAARTAEEVLRLDRDLTRALVSAQRPDAASHLDARRLGRHIRAVFRAISDPFADLLAIEPSQQLRGLDLGPTGRFRRPFDVWSITGRDEASDETGDKEAA